MSDITSSSNIKTIKSRAKDASKLLSKKLKINVPEEAIKNAVINNLKKEDDEVIGEIVDNQLIQQINLKNQFSKSEFESIRKFHNNNLKSKIYSSPKLRKLGKKGRFQFFKISK